LPVFKKCSFALSAKSIFSKDTFVNTTDEQFWLQETDTDKNTDS